MAIVIVRDSCVSVQYRVEALFYLQWQDTPTFGGYFNLLSPFPRAGLTIRGPHTNVRRGPFSRTRSQDFLICDGALFSEKS